MMHGTHNVKLNKELNRKERLVLMQWEIAFSLLFDFFFV